MSLDNFKLPSLRDIFYQFELTEQTTEEYDNTSNAINKLLNEHIPDFETNNKIDCLITGLMVEAQVIGFEQGFEMALKLLGYSNTKGAGSPDV